MKAKTPITRGPKQRGNSMLEGSLIFLPSLR
jgi:hypothetical protein